MEIGMPLLNPVLIYKSGVQGGIHYTDMFSSVMFSWFLVFVVLLIDVHVCLNILSHV